MSTHILKKRNSQHSDYSNYLNEFERAYQDLMRQDTFIGFEGGSLREFAQNVSNKDISKADTQIKIKVPLYLLLKAYEHKYGHHCKTAAELNKNTIAKHVESYDAYETIQDFVEDHFYGFEAFDDDDFDALIDFAESDEFDTFNEDLDMNSFEGDDFDNLFGKRKAINEKKQEYKSKGKGWRKKWRKDKHKIKAEALKNVREEKAKNKAERKANRKEALSKLGTFAGELITKVVDSKLGGNKEKEEVVDDLKKKLTPDEDEPSKDKPQKGKANADDTDEPKSHLVWYLAGGGVLLAVIGLIIYLKMRD